VNREARRDLEYLRAILASGVFGSGDLALAVAVVCDHLERMLDEAEGSKGSVRDTIEGKERAA
jgi:hypothetical protein